jgi:hypothetical protein
VSQPTTSPTNFKKTKMTKRKKKGKMSAYTLFTVNKWAKHGDTWRAKGMRAQNVTRHIISKMWRAMDDKGKEDWTTKAIMANRQMAQEW